MTDTTSRAAEYTLSTSDLDLERRRAIENGEDPDIQVGARDFTGGRDDDDLADFVGVDPSYRNYGNEVDRPIAADGDTPQGFFEAKHVEASDGIIVGADRDAAPYVLPGLETEEVDDESPLVPPIPAPEAPSVKAMPARPAVKSSTK